MKATITQIESVVTPSGNSGHVVVPKAWIGKEAVVVLKEGKAKQKSVLFFYLHIGCSADSMLRDLLLRPLTESNSIVLPRVSTASAKKKGKCLFLDWSPLLPIPTRRRHVLVRSYQLTKLTGVQEYRVS